MWSVAASTNFANYGVSGVRWQHTDARRTLATAFVANQVDYCNAVLYGTSSAVTRQLQMVLNAAARMVVGIGKYKYEHITSVLRDTLHWLPVTARIQFKIAALTFNCVRSTGTVYLRQVICPVSDLSRRSLRSADRGDLFVSRANTSIGQRSFSIAAPVVWNALPPDLRSPHNSRRQSRSKLKPHLFRQAYTAWFLWEHCWRV